MINKSINILRICLALWFGVLIFNPPLSFANINESDTLHDGKEDQDSDTTRVKKLNARSLEFIYKTPDSTLFYATQALRLAKKIDWKNGISNAYHNVGYAHYMFGEFSKCLYNWKQGLEIWNEMSQIPENVNHEFIKFQQSKALGNIGLVYSYQGNDAMALKFYFEALKMKKELKILRPEHIEYKKQITVTIGNIGLVYAMQRDYKTALSYYGQALESDKKFNDKQGMARHYGNIGIAYSELGQFSKALEAYQKALELFNQLGNKDGIAKTLSNIGIEHQNLSQYADAEKFFQSALHKAKELGDKGGQAINYGNLGAVCIKTGKFESAKFILDSSLALIYEIEILEGLFRVHDLYVKLYDTLAIIALQQKQISLSELHYEKALHHNRLFDQAKDSLFNEEKSTGIGRLEMRFETEVAEMKREQALIVEKRSAQEYIYRRNQLQYSAIFLVILILFVLMIFGWKFRILERWSKGSIFFIFLLLFEFLLVLIDPYVEQVTDGEPGFKLIINAILAGLIFPVHSFAESWMKQKLMIRGEKDKVKTPNQIDSSNRMNMLIILICTLIVHSGFINTFNEITPQESPQIDSIKTELKDILNNPIDKKSNRNEVLQNVNNAFTTSKTFGSIRQKMELAKLFSETYEKLESFKNAYTAHVDYVDFKDSLFNQEQSKTIGRLEQKHDLEMAALKRKREEAERRRISLAEQARRNHLQYAVVLLVLVSLVIVMIFRGKLRIAPNLGRGFVFLIFLLLFEFLLVLADPYIEKYSGGQPVYQLVLNALIAMLIFPMHSWAEAKLIKQMYIKNQ